MRLHAVKRWHMIDTTRSQNLAEHSANVALLAYLIATTIGGVMFPPDRCSQIAFEALVHDIGETMIGDIPAHTKSAVRKHSEALDALEDLAIPPEFVVLVEPNSSLLIKVCDLADGIRFIRLHGVDITARHAREGLEVQFATKRAEAFNLWPQASASVLSSMAYFYAYELS